MTRLKDLFLDISSPCTTSSTLLLFIANLGLYCDQRGKEKEVKIVQTTIQQISANPARPQSMQPNIFIRRKYLKKTGDFLEKFLIWCELPAAINLLSISLLLVSI